MATGGIELAPLLAKIVVDISGFDVEMRKAKEIATNTAKQIEKELELTRKVGEKFSEIGKRLTLGVTTPLAGIGVACGKMALDFEDSFAQVTTLLDENITDFGEYRDEIIKASSESGIAIGEFSEAVYGSISAGVDSGNAIQFTTEAMKLAKGGFTDGASAVDILTTAINGYKLKTEDATKISDLLITTQNLGKTTVDELASSMGAVIPVASSVNFNIEELSTAYAVLTKNGIATSEAGTYMKSMLSELSKSGSLTDKALKELAGKGFAELKAEGNSTTDILKMLDDYAKANGQSLKDMFGSVEAGSAALVLANQNGAEYNEILEAMRGSAGATDGAFEKVTGTLNEKFKKALNEVKNAGIKLADSFMPIIEKLVDKFGKFANKIGELNTEQLEMVLKVGLVVASIGPMLGAIGGGIKAYANLKTAIGVVQGVMTKLGISFGAILGPIALVVAGIVLFAVAWKTNFGNIRENTQIIMDSIKNIIEVAWNFLKELWNNNFMFIKDLTGIVFESIKQIFETALEVISGVFEVFASLFKGDWEGAWNGVKEIMGNVWELIKNLFSNALEVILLMLLNIGGLLWDAGVTVMNFLKDAFVNVWNAIKEWWGRVKEDPVGYILSIGTNMFNAGKSILSSLWDGLKNVWSSISTWFSDKISWISEKVAFWRNSRQELDGSHYNGLSYVPFDGYTARLHKGERVLTAKENAEYMMGKANGETSNSGFSIRIENFVNNRKQDVKAFAEELEFYRKQVSYGGGRA